MSIMTVLIVCVFSVICFLNYQQELNVVYDDLNEAISRGYAVWVESSNGSDSENAPFQERQGKHNFQFGGAHGQGGRTPVSVYQLVDADSYIFISSASPYSLSDEVLESALNTIQNVKEDRGTLPSLGLIYAKRDFKGGATVAFADASAASGWQSLAVTLIGVGLATLLIIFLISLVFSKWALRPVKEAWHNQQRFISDASHELKTPLTVMSANISILQKNMDKTIASQSQWVESTEEEIANMRELVDDMLFIASTDEHAHDASKDALTEKINLSKIVNGQVLQFEALAFENKIQFDSNIQDDIWIKGNAARLQRLIRTLLDNACKYSGENNHVQVDLTREGNTEQSRIVLSVANTGSYISEEDLPHIFERFYRADKARVRENGSYGLGLSIARDIAEEHGGDLTVESSPETGTVFTITWN